MLHETCESTKEFLNEKTKTERKKIGQFFTSEPAARFMGRLFDPKYERIRIADPGAGTGLLTASVIDYLADSGKNISLVVDMFENDDNVLPVLKKNILRWRQLADSKGLMLEVNLIEENFITANQLKWHNGFYSGEYDFIISNPPYKKIQKTALEARIMDKIVYGQPNLYFLFMAMASNLLKPEGEMVFIVPRSWTSGLYFKAFREYFLNQMRIDLVHQFVSRKKVFDHEDVLQETVIVKATKTECGKSKLIISSSNSINDFSEPMLLHVPYDLCVEQQGDRYIYLPIDEEEIEILKAMKTFDATLESIGFHMKTGPTVDFRSQDAIHDNPEDDDCPLLWSQHFSSGQIRFPRSDLSGQYISSSQRALLINNDNYLFVKRFSSKEEKRRLQPAIFLEMLIDNYKTFSAENHLNYITNTHGGLDVQEVYGLYVIFNSTMWDRYYRILNGSTQVNATECNGLPMPDIETVRRLGDRMKKEKILSTEVCDRILKEELRGFRRREDDIVRAGYARKSAV